MRPEARAAEFCWRRDAIDADRVGRIDDVHEAGPIGHGVEQCINVDPPFGLRREGRTPSQGGERAGVVPWLHL